MSLNDASELRGGDDSRAIVGGALVGAQRGVLAGDSSRRSASRRCELSPVPFFIALCFRGSNARRNRA
jgi:hypothetical protein